MATKRLEWQIGFSADTTQLKRQLNDVKLQLKDISSLKFADKGFPLTEQMEQASLAASDLLQKLNQATNIQTGNLDLSKFRKSLEDGGKSLAQYQQELGSIGETGQRAFLSIAASIANAEPPFRRLSTLTEKMMITLKNTLRWQVSTATLNAFIGAIQTAYGYSKDLNESLNNIRIVSGKSVEQMSRFAEDANKAAARLSSTTLDYTNAALIFFQQGLSEDEVKRRTDITLQLAEVTGKSVETVSSQLTAIWNNFSDGSDDLARYADVLTRLGAVTASSSDEIAEGMQKFSAVANTVGLSYDYAAAALATLTATTRESADTVGTSLRTIFARLESLQLGETLEDGVTLTKYSEALQTAGVEVLDVNGKLKDMNTILDETMQAWAGLDQAQRTALATTVAGVRQYAQFIALMDNQDFFRQNVEEAENATGTLKEQAQVYAESWEAARDRVKNAAQDVYDSLIDEDFFISADHLLEQLLHGIANVIDGLGGMRGILLILGNLFTTVFGKQLAQGLRNLSFNISLYNKQQQKANAEFQRQAANILANSEWSDARSKGLAVELGLNQRIAEVSDKITGSQKSQLEGLAHLISMETELVQEAKLRLQEEEKTTTAIENSAKLKLIANGKYVTRGFNFKQVQDLDTYDFLTGSNYQAANLTTKGTRKSSPDLFATYAKLNKQLGAMKQASKELNKELGDNFTVTDTLTESQAQLFSRVSMALKNVDVNLEENGSNFGELSGHIQNTEAVVEALKQALLDMFKKTQDGIDISEKDLDEYAAKMRQVGEETQKVNEGTGLIANSEQRFLDSLNSLQLKTKDWAIQVVSAGNALFVFGQFMTSIKTLMEEVKEGTADFTTVITSLGMALLSFGQLIPTIGGVIEKVGELYAVLVPLIGSGGAIGVIIAIIGAIVAAGVAIGNAVKNSKKAEKELKQAQETAEKAKESFNSAKQAYDNLVSGNENYQSLLKELDNLTAGSKAFEDQLIKVNDQANALVELLPKLKDYVYFDENGVARFKPGWENVVEEQRGKIALQSFGTGVLASDVETISQKEPEDSQEALKKKTRFQAQGLLGERANLRYSDLLTKAINYSNNGASNDEWIALYQDLQSKNEPAFYPLLRSINQVIKQNKENIEQESQLQQLIDEDDRKYRYSQLLSNQDFSILSSYGALYAKNKINLPASDTNLEAIARYFAAAANEESDISFEKIKNKSVGSLPVLLSTAISRYEQESGNANFSLDTTISSLAEDAEKWQDFLYNVYQPYLDDLYQKQLQIGAEFDEQINNLPEGISDQVKTSLVEAAIGLRTGTDGLELEDIKYIKENAEAIKTALGEQLKESGDEQGYTYLAGWIDEVVNMSLDEAKEQSRQNVKNFVSGLGSLFKQLLDGVKFEDLSKEDQAIYSKLRQNYGEYLDIIESMEEDSFQRREATRDFYDMIIVDSLKHLSEVGASSLEVIEVAFKNIDTQIESSISTLEDYFDLLSSIPEDLKISFDEMRQYIEQGHGEILQNAEITSTGEIKLNKEKVKEYVEGVQEEYRADLEQRKKTLELQRDILQAELDHYNGLSDAQKLSYLQNITTNHSLAQALDATGTVGEEAGQDIKKSFADVKTYLEYCTAQAQALYEAMRTGEVPQELKDFLDTYVDDTGNLPTNVRQRLEDTWWKNFIPEEFDEQFQTLSDTFTSGIESRLTILTTEINLIDQALSEDMAKSISDYLDALGEESDAQDKLLDQLKDALERYHEINRALQNLEREYSRLEKYADRMYGKKHLDALAQEEESIKEQIKLQKQKMLAVQANLTLDLEAAKKLAPSLVIDNQGEITNYSEILRKAAAEYNNAIKDTNGMSDTEKEKYEADLENLKERYENLKDALDQYEETLDEMHDLEDKILEGEYLFEDKRLESLNYQLELIIDTKENEDAINEFGKKLAESFGDYLTHGQESLDFDAALSAANQALLPQLKEQWNSLVDMYNNATSFTDQAEIVKQLESVRDQVYSTMESLLDYIDTLENALPDAVDAARERFDSMLDQVSHTKTIYDSIKQLLELQGLTEHTQEGYARLMDIAQKSMEAEILNAQMQKEWYENAYTRLMEAEAALEQVQEGDDSYDLLKNARDALLEEYNAAQEAMMESAIAALEKAKEMFESEIEKAKEDFSKALTGGLGLDFMQDRYDRFIDEEERYLDAVNEEYEVSKWNRKLQEQIDKAKSQSAIDRLKELQKEIDVRRANNTLSEYDLEILNAKYEMTLKQIALEEAQSSATNMRLQRDSQGNWNYVYTADYDNVLQAQQDFEDAANNYYNIAKQQVKDVTQEILDTWQECADRIAEIYEDETLTVEEREARIAEIRAYYAEKVRALEEEKNVALQDIYDASADIARYYEDMYNQSLDDMTDRNGMYREDFSNDIQQMLDDMNNFLNNFTADLGDMTAATGDFEQLFNNYLQQAGQAAQNYQNTVDQVTQQTGTTLDELQNHMSQVTETVVRLNQNMANSYQQFGYAGMNAIDSIWSRIPTINSLTDSFARQTQEIYALIRAYQEWIATQSQGIWNNNDVQDFATPSDFTTQHTDYEDDWQGPWFEHGGYTGPGTQAMPAVLHGSEYVLNKEDTTKILSAAALMKSLNLDTLLSIIDTLRGNASISRSNLGNFVNLPGFGMPDRPGLQQAVTIYADFPNASDSEEIKQAFDNLINRAIQYTEIKDY